MKTAIVCAAMPYQPHPVGSADRGGERIKKTIPSTVSGYIAAYARGSLVVITRRFGVFSRRPFKSEVQRADFWR
jgi:hypothetical protein